MMNDKKPHFLEVFLPNLTSERLEVPSKFLKHLRRITSGALALIGPSGNTWHVDLIDHNGHLFFDDGWPTFVKDHFIQCGDCLVFRYDGNSQFTVQIFDQTSCEKDEALNAKCSQESINCNGNLGKKRGRGKEASLLNVVGEEKHNGTLVEVQLDLPAGYREKELKFCRNENENHSRTGEFDAAETHIVFALPCSSNTDWKAIVVKPSSKKSGYNMNKAANKKQNIAVDISISKFIESRSAEYITSNSPYFVRVMNHSNINGNGTMIVPMKFSVVHLPNYKTKVTLRNLNGDCWMVNCVTTAKKSSTMHTFSGGWLAFVRGNGIKIEDVCIFELVGELEMLVRILRLGAEAPENQTEKIFDEISGCPVESAAEITQDTSRDQFLIDSELLNDLYLYDYEDYKVNTEIMTALQHEETASFAAGGDITVHMSTIMPVLSPLSMARDEYTDNVLCNAVGSILNETSRDNEVVDFNDSLDNPAPVEESTEYITFSSPFPSFKKVMVDSSVGKSFTLNVPRAFSAAHIPSHKTNIVLRNMKGQSWVVAATRYGQQTKFCGGWMSFVRENGVKVGDVCIFELVDEKVLQVRVFEGGHKEQQHHIGNVADDSTIYTDT